MIYFGIDDLSSILPLSINLIAVTFLLIDEASKIPLNKMFKGNLNRLLWPYFPGIVVSSEVTLLYKPLEISTLVIKCTVDNNEILIVFLYTGYSWEDNHIGTFFLENRLGYAQATLFLKREYCLKVGIGHVSENIEALRKGFTILRFIAHVRGK